MSLAEQQNLALGAVGGDELGCHEVDSEEEDDVANENTKVSSLKLVMFYWYSAHTVCLPPHVRLVVAKMSIHVKVAINKVGPRHGPSYSTSTLRRCRVRIGRHVVGARKLASSELVGDKALESVGDGVDVVDPTEPALHAAGREDEAGVDDQG